MVNEVVAVNTFEGTSYVLLASAAIVVRDEDANQLITRVNYPSMAAAEVAYADAIAKAEATA